MHSTYPSHVFNTEGDPIPPIPLENNDLIWVDNTVSFNSMLSDLKQATEIAVDLEHHDYRSYHGFVCLMQISTRKQDWIVDTLELREELIALNQVFTNPQIVKVRRSFENINLRYSMVQVQMLSGYNGISGSTLLAYSIRFMHRLSFNYPLNLWHISSSNTAMSKPTRSTSSQTGDYGLFRQQC